MRAVLLVVAILLALSFLSAAFIVHEWEQVILTQFGEPVTERVDGEEVPKILNEPGLRFKLPLIQTVHRFDKRFLEWQGSPEELPTKDKVFIWVDTYARWRIRDPLLYFQRLRDEVRAHSRLDDILDGETRNAIAKHNLIEVICSATKESQPSEEPAEPQQVEAPPEEAPAEVCAAIRVGRDGIRREILAAAQEGTADLGIEVLDVQFRRINYGDQVKNDVYARMISERNRVAERYRSEGQGERAEILGKMERELKQIESEAYRQAEEIMGQADAEAADIYAGAYDQSTDSRAFYEFVKSMETLRNTVDAETSLLLSTDGDFYRYLKSSGR
jgi:membrane protease subunit HflC